MGYEMSPHENLVMALTSFFNDEFSTEWAEKVGLRCGKWVTGGVF